MRRDTQVDYMLFPRLLALAERAWAKPGWQPSYVPGATYALGDPRVDRATLTVGWRDFAGRMAVQLRALDRAGITYRIAPPGARIVAGRLEANTELPGMPVEYRLAGGPWRRYTGPVAVRGAVDLRGSQRRRPPGRPYRDGDAGGSAIVGALSLGAIARAIDRANQPLATGVGGQIGAATTRHAARRSDLTPVAIVHCLTGRRGMGMV